MKTLKTLTVVMLILLVTFLLVQPVNARGHGGGGHGGRGGGHPWGDPAIDTVTAFTPITRDMAGWWGYRYRWGYRYYPYYYSFKPET